MGKFDIITAAGNAYQKSWASRQYLLRLAAVPIALKLLCFTIAGIYAGGTAEQNGNYMLFMLIMVPALMAEGWMLAHFVRFLVLGQTWPFKPTGDFEADRAMLSVRARGILSGMIVFVLVSMVEGCLKAATIKITLPYMSLDLSSREAVETIPAYISVFCVALLAFWFWSFRFLWLHVPLALNMEMKTYLRAVRGGTFYLIALWLVCYVPFILVMQVLGPLLAALPGGIGNSAITILYIFVDSAKNIVTTAGVTFLLRDIFTGKQGVGRRA